MCRPSMFKTLWSHLVDYFRKPVNYFKKLEEARQYAAYQELLEAVNEEVFVSYAEKLLFSANMFIALPTEKKARLLLVMLSIEGQSSGGVLEAVQTEEQIMKLFVFASPLETLGLALHKHRYAIKGLSTTHQYNFQKFIYASLLNAEQHTSNTLNKCAELYNKELGQLQTLEAFTNLTSTITNPEEMN